MAAEALSTPPPGDIRILVGPVIGFVTNTTARVLVEVDKRCSLSCVLQPVSETGSPVGDPRVVVVDLEPFHPEVARFFYLLPGQRYQVGFRGAVNDAERVGSFTTLPDVVTRYKVICAACDKDKKRNRGPVIMWERLFDKFLGPDATEHLDLLIHHGDQVYADHAFAASKRFFDNGADHRPNNAKIQAATEAYQSIYRRVWNRPETARVLANIPNICMWDDHEVRNDWGSKAEDRTPGTVAYMIGLGARQAYWWYQRQLWDDLPGSEALVRDALQQQVEFAASKPSADAGSESAGAVADDEAVHVGVRVVERPASEGESKTDVTHSSPGLLSAIPSSTLARVTDDQTHSPASVKLRVSTRNASQVQRLLQTVELRVPSPVHLVSPPAGRIMEPQTESIRKLLPGGKVGLFVADMRGSQSFMYSSQGRRYFGESQWAEFEDAYSATGLFQACSTVVAVHSSPAVFFGSTCSRMCSCLSKDKMGLGLHPAEQEAYLDLLVEWKSRSLPGGKKRSLLLVGGDMHFAVSTTVSRGGTPVLRQVISSAISNKPPFWFQFYLFRAIMGCCPGNGAYSWSHSDYFPAQNFVVISMDADEGIVHYVVEKSRWVCCNYRGCLYC